MKLFGGKKQSGRGKREAAGKLSFFRRHRKALSIAGCAVLLAAMVLVVHAVLVRPPERQTAGLAAPAESAIRPAVPERVIATPPPEDLPPPPEESAAPEPTKEPVNYRKESCYTFVLLVRDQVSGGTDTILVGCLDTELPRVDFVSIPRDTLVNVEWGVKKANTIYTYEHEDPQRFIAQLSGLLGFAVDNYAVMNLWAVQRVADAMGGVWYDMPRSMDYDDPTQELSIHIPAGPQQLSGADVVKALRFRVGNDGSGYPDGDIGRINFQHGLLKSMAKQFLTLGNIPNLTKIIDIFQEEVKTDLTAGNLAFFAEQFLRMDADAVSFHTAPGSGISIQGGSYYELDLENWLPLVNETLNPYAQPVTERNLDVLQFLGQEGAVSTTGEIVPLYSFYNFYDYTG